MFPIDWTKLLNPKNIVMLVVSLLMLGAAIYGGVKVYNWVYDRGAASRDPEVAEAQRLQKEAEDNYKRYKGEYDNWMANTKKANEQYIKEQLADLDARQKRLTEAETAARNKPATIQEVIKYVPAEVDAAYRLPVGLIRLYNDTLQGTTGTYSGTGLPGGFQVDAGEASGTTMSQFGQVAAFNNTECVLRGKVVEEWQDWYSVNKAKFDALQKQQQETAPKP